jgi:hypothetical protein
MVAMMTFRVESATRPISSRTLLVGRSLGYASVQLELEFAKAERRFSSTGVR